MNWQHKMIKRGNAPRCTMLTVRGFRFSDYDYDCFDCYDRYNCYACYACYARVLNRCVLYRCASAVYF